MLLTRKPTERERIVLNKILESELSLVEINQLLVGDIYFGEIVYLVFELSELHHLNKNMIRKLL
jgi:hypothetical protein